MSPAEQIQALRDLLKLGKVPDEKTSTDRVFLLGWNAGIEFAQNQINKIFGKET